MKRKLVITVLAFFALIIAGMSQANAQVYARLERGTLVTEYYSGYNVKYYTTVVVRFYSNAACTIPTTTPIDIDVEVNLEEIDYPTGGWPPYGSNTPTTITAYSGSGSVDGWYNIQMIDCYDGSTDTVIYTLSLLPGSGYIVVN